MTDHIICPHQETEGFTFEQCRQCSAFQLTKGIDSKISVSCRKQQTRSHKTGFQSAYLLHSLCMPYQVCVDGREERGVS